MHHGTAMLIGVKHTASIYNSAKLRSVPWLIELLIYKERKFYQKWTCKTLNTMLIKGISLNRSYWFIHTSHAFIDLKINFQKKRHIMIGNAPLTSASTLSCYLFYNGLFTMYRILLHQTNVKISQFSSRTIIAVNILKHILLLFH